MSGDILKQNHGPQRIACLQPSATVILSAVGQLERVVACTRYCADVVPEVVDGQRLIVADSWTAQTDQILAAKPDLVIAAVPYQEDAVAQILRAGIRFLGLSPKTLDDIFTDIAVIAGAVGASEQGNAVIAGMESAIEKFRVQTMRAKRLRVFCEEWGKPIIASQPWVRELVEAAGGEFVGTPGAQISIEQVAAMNPEVLVAAWCGAGDRVPLEKLAARPGWDTTAAVRDGKVYCIPDEFLNTPAPTLVQGLEALAAAIHPEMFSTPSSLRKITDVRLAATAPRLE